MNPRRHSGPESVEPSGPLSLSQCNPLLLFLLLQSSRQSPVGQPQHALFFLPFSWQSSASLEFRSGPPASVSLSQWTEERMELTLNGDSYEVASLGGLRYHLPKVFERQFCEVWLYSESGWPAICALVNNG